MRRGSPRRGRYGTGPRATRRRPWHTVGMADQDTATPAPAAWSFDPTGGQAAVPAAPSIGLPPSLSLPPGYFASPGANGTTPAAASVFAGQYDPGPAGSGNPLDAMAGNIGQMLEHPGGSPVGVSVGDKSLQYAPAGGIIPGLVDAFQFRPYVEGVPGMGPPGMPAPWESGH